MIETMTKVELAERQLRRAVLLFLNEKDYVSATTLAGAADGILEQYVKRRGDRTAVECEVEILEGLSEPTEAPMPRKTWFNLLKFPQNELKHFSQPEHDQITSNFREDAKEVLNRALWNYYLLHGKHFKEALRYLRRNKKEDTESEN